MFGFDQNDRPPSLIRATLKSVAVVAVLSWMAAGWLSTAARDQATLSRLAQNISQGREDPLTTGSIGSRAGATRLDPCSAARR